MVELVRGQRVALAALAGGEPPEVYLGVRLALGPAGGAGGGLDVGCLGLDGAGRLSDERWFVFYNQPSSPGAAARLVDGRDGDTTGLLLRLDEVPDSIGRFMITVSVDAPATMSEVADGRLRLVAAGRELATYAFTRADFSSERAVVLGEVYRRDGWRLTAAGQGFDGGLAELIETVGGDVAETGGPPPPPAPPPPPSPPPPPAPRPPPSAPPPSAQVPSAPLPSAPAPLPSAPPGGPALEPSPWGTALPVAHPRLRERPVWGVPVR
jgi:stress response protein SCP2